MEKLKKFLDDGYKLIASDNHTVIGKSPEIKIIQNIWDKYYPKSEFAGYSISMSQTDKIIH